MVMARHRINLSRAWRTDKTGSVATATNVAASELAGPFDLGSKLPGGDGLVGSLIRNFNRPTGLADSEATIVLEDFPSGLPCLLNGQHLGETDWNRSEFRVETLLKNHNRLIVVSDWPGETARAWLEIAEVDGTDS